MKLVHLSTGFLWYVRFKVNIKYYCKVVRYTWYSLYVFMRFGEEVIRRSRILFEVGLVACEISCERELFKRKSRSTSC